MSMQDDRSNRCALVQQSAAGSTDCGALRGGAAGAATLQADAAPHVYDIGIRITRIDRAIIRRYFQECHCAKTASTTAIPGHSRRQWTQNGGLRAKLYRSALPAALDCKLSALPGGYERVLVDDDVLLIETATQRIVDTMRNVCASVN